MQLGIHRKNNCHYHDSLHRRGQTSQHGKSKFGRNHFKRASFPDLTNKYYFDNEKIGLMRSGHLLAEDSPANLLKIHQCIGLEDVFLKLCMKDKSTNNTGGGEILRNNVVGQDGTLNIVSVYNDRNRSHFERGLIDEENGIVGLKFHQSKDYLVSSDDVSTETKPDPMLNRINKVAEDCSDCCQKPCFSFDPRPSLNRLRAMTIKNFICMWRNIG